MDYKIGDLTKEEAIYIGEKINEIVPREVDADEEEFVLKIENENGEIIEDEEEFEDSYEDEVYDADDFDNDNN